MNPYPYSFLALDLARERAEAAERAWLAAQVRGGGPPAGRIRSLAARALASVSRASAIVVRRLDSCIADDPRRALAPAE